MHAMREALERRLSLLVSERSRKIYAFLLGEDDAGKRIEHGVILVKGAGILSERIEQPAQSSRVDRGMDDESRLIDRPIADQDIALMVDELQIRHPDLAEMLGQRIDPEAL
jgi:hypothetical protein